MELSRSLIAVSRISPYGSFSAYREQKEIFGTDEGLNHTMFRQPTF
jgi:hypothetical protein